MTREHRKHKPRPEWSDALLSSIERAGRGGDVVDVRDGVPFVAVPTADLIAAAGWIRNLRARLNDERRHRGGRA